MARPGRRRLAGGAAAPPTCELASSDDRLRRAGPATGVAAGADRRPVLAATVLDSDGAQLVGYSPGAGRWSGWLMLERMIEYIGSPYTHPLNDYNEEDLPEDLDAFWQERYELACRPLYELVPPAATAAPRAVAWAVEAGFAPEVDTVAA